MNLDLLFKRALERGISEIEAYELMTDTTSLSVFKREALDTLSAKTTVTFFRGGYNGHLGSFYVENKEMDIDKIIDQIIENAKAINTNEPYIIYPGEKDYPTISLEEADFSQHTNLEKIEMLLALEKEIYAQSNLVCSTTEIKYNERYYECHIKNSLGLDVKKKGSYAYILAGAIVKSSEEVKNSYDIAIAKKWAQLDYHKLAVDIVKDAVSQLGGSPIKSGIYRTVIKNTVMGDLLSAYSDMFSAQASLRKMSLLTGKEGQKVFGENITIYDDPLANLALTRDTFDDEGVAAYKKTLVDKGVFKTFLHNLKTAKIFNTKSTANGYKNGVSSPIGIKPSNLYIANGTKTLEELFRECNNGIYLTEITGLHAGINPITGDFSLQSQGYVIKDGKLAEPISLIVSSGNFITLLNNVLAIGNNLEFKGENVLSPALLVDGLAISGK